MQNTLHICACMCTRVHLQVHARARARRHTHTHTHTHTHRAPKFYLGSITSWVLCRYAFCSEHRRDLLDQLLQNGPLTEVLPSEHCNMTHTWLLITSSSIGKYLTQISPASTRKSQHRSVLSHELCQLMESCWTDQSNNVKHNSHVTENPSTDESKSLQLPPLIFRMQESYTNMRNQTANVRIT